MKKNKTLVIKESHVYDGMTGYLQAMGMLNDDEEVTGLGAVYTDTSTDKKQYKLIIDKVA